ncbi:hypothetical protein CMQ_2444 [Grosmannia clavigera kw1407]|uniref:DUF4334 domain-containing protein n=1 Tax=Grosmannia clavigera (strain kw1407 / UAMH 11150) TaxID=655863 RepID=F0XJK9_GROCL|nr:uncharacterized protein CMQ_2444 [Grosmannia clavigera kw1407]EFX02395.1 hypothetical protein CMQ_2444 [Grosmannia clavigera kw1407]
MTAVQRFNALTKAEGLLKESELAQIFDELPPVSPEAMTGKWNGGSFDSGHPVHKLLQTFKWAGKEFRSVDDIDPIVIFDENGERKWLSEYGHARLREVKFRGVVSAALVYDKVAIIDSFRRVSDNVLMGTMDARDWPDAGIYYFYITKFEEL